MRAFLKQYDIQAESWFPIGHGSQKILNDPLLLHLAEKYDRTLVQIILRWHVQEGLIPLPKAVDPVHLKENIHIFDFHLEDKDMEKIEKLDTGRSFFQDEYDRESEEERAAEYLNIEHPDYDSQK